MGCNIETSKVRKKTYGTDIRGLRYKSKIDIKEGGGGISFSYLYEYLSMPDAVIISHQLHVTEYEICARFCKFTSGILSLFRHKMQYGKKRKFIKYECTETHNATGLQISSIGSQKQQHTQLNTREGNYIYNSKATTDLNHDMESVRTFSCLKMHWLLQQSSVSCLT